MTILNNLPLWAKMAVICLFVMWAVKLWLNHRHAEKDFPASDYTPTDSPDAWEWAEPPESWSLVRVKNDQSSCIKMAVSVTGNEVVLSLIGAFFIGMGVWLLGYIALAARDRFSMAIWVVFAVWFMGWMFLNGSTPVISIERTSDAIIITTRWGVFFRRKTRFRANRARHYSFSGNLQRTIEMTTDQLDSLPDYYLMAKRSFGISRRFIMRCNPSEATWLIGGLNQWLTLQCISKK